MSAEIPNDVPIFSIYEGNDVYQPLLSDFVAALRGKVSEIGKSLQGSDVNELARLCHKFCGSASTYGFPQVAAVAKQMEDLVRNGDTTDQMMLKDKLAGKFHELTQICAHVATKK